MAFFLTDDRMLTPRGLAMGDDQSTAEMLYGAPQKLEMDTSTGSPRTAYVYFSQGQKEVLILYFKIKKWMASCAPEIHSGESDLSPGIHF